MGATEQIDAAYRAVGDNADDDFVIDPTAHAGALEETAPLLAEVLRGSRVQSAARDYDKWDGVANEAKSRFKKYSNRANWSVFAAACASALLLALSIVLESSPEGAQTPLNPKNLALAVVAFFGMVAGVVAGVWFNIIRTGGLLEAWMKSRAEAEMRRLKYFETVTSTASRRPEDETDLRLLELEFFRRFQVDVQQAYYRVRSKQHEGGAHKALVWTSVAMGGVALANALSGYLAPFDARFTAIAGLAVLSQAIASKITNTEAINQNRGNAERYRQVETTLNGLRGRLDEVRLGIVDANAEMLPAFVQAVHEQLALEHRQWLQDVRDAGTAITRLEDQLKGNKPKQIGGGSGSEENS